MHYIYTHLSIYNIDIYIYIYGSHIYIYIQIEMCVCLILHGFIIIILHLEWKYVKPILAGSIQLSCILPLTILQQLGKYWKSASVCSRDEKKITAKTLEVAPTPRNKITAIGQWGLSQHVTTPRDHDCSVTVACSPGCPALEWQAWQIKFRLFILMSPVLPGDSMGWLGVIDSTHDFGRWKGVRRSDRGEQHQHHRPTWTAYAEMARQFPWKLAPKALLHAGHAPSRGVSTTSACSASCLWILLSSLAGRAGTSREMNVMVAATQVGNSWDLLLNKHSNGNIPLKRRLLHWQLQC